RHLSVGSSRPPNAPQLSAPPPSTPTASQLVCIDEAHLEIVLSPLLAFSPHQLTAFLSSEFRQVCPHCTFPSSAVATITTRPFLVQSNDTIDWFDGSRLERGKLAASSLMH